jgi:hypothetical protein
MISSEDGKVRLNLDVKIIDGELDQQYLKSCFDEFDLQLFTIQNSRISTCGDFGKMLQEKFFCCMV